VVVVEEEEEGGRWIPLLKGVVVERAGKKRYKSGVNVRGEEVPTRIAAGEGILPLVVVVVVVVGKLPVEVSTALENQSLGREEETGVEVAVLASKEVGGGDRRGRGRSAPAAAVPPAAAGAAAAAAPERSSG